MIARIYVAESRAELTKLVRLPAYAIPTVAFPIVFYVFFGILTQRHDAIAARYLLASFGAFGTVGAALFGFGVGIAIERGQGWLAVKQASPMPPSAYIVAKICGSLAFAAIVAAALCAIASIFGHVSMPGARWAALATVLVLGALPFCALGLALGALVKPNAAAAVVNLIYLPLSFCAGLWEPIEQLPPSVRRIAPFLPTYHLGQLALGTIGFGHSSPLWHIASLTIWASVGTAIAVWALGRDEGGSHG